MGHVLGTEKGHFLIRGRRAAMAKWRPRRFNPVNPCQICLPGVAWGRYYTRASAYTAWAAASSIFGRFLSAAHGVLAVLGHGLLPRLSESPGSHCQAIHGPVGRLVERNRLKMLEATARAV